jgi:hypothetical protein
MRLERKDLTAASVAIVIVGVLVTTAAGWGVPLIGDSHRWAAVAIVVLALIAGTLEAPGTERPANLLAALVVVGFLAAVLAIATGSLAALLLLVVDVLALIAVDAARHVRQARGTPATT